MNTERELALWLDATIPEGKPNKPRDIKAVLLYYGFGNDAEPTLEQIGEQLSIGTRERVRQVLSSTFKAKASIDDFPVLRAALQRINQLEFTTIPEIREELVNSGVISQNTHIRGLLKLGSDLSAIGAYELVDHELCKLTRSEAEFEEVAFIGTNTAITRLRVAYQKAKTLPGQLGLASRHHLADLIGLEAADNAWSLIKLRADSKFIQDGDQEWYILEDRGNNLVNNCEKIFSLTDRVESSALAEVLSNALHRRSNKYGHEYPDTEIVLKWIKQSKWFEVADGVASFLGSRAILTEIERAVVDYLTGKTAIKYPPLKDHLLRLGFTKPNIDKAVTASPLVYVDRSGERGLHTYTLVSEVPFIGQQAVEPNSRYIEFKSRLERLLQTGGTEIPREELVRREQSILREWLFGECLSEKCAVCGKEFSIRALITAHKKNRSSCTLLEKTDPRIVFPLCLFGCDFLYETRMIRIVNGTVLSNYDETMDTADVLAAKALNGSVVNDKWLEGDQSYFATT